MITIISFVIFLILMTSVGVYASTKKKNTSEDYLLADRDVGPWAVALSAVSTNNSGFMFIGLIGMTYLMGLSVIWLSMGWVIGDYMGWFFIHKKLREKSEQAGSRTIASFVGSDDGNVTTWPTRLLALMTLIFLSVYAAAQLVAGSKALHVMLGWEPTVGVLLGAAIVLAYCFSGGIRASIWTDVLQSTIMFGAMLLLLVVALAQIGGIGALFAQLAAIDPALIGLNPGNLALGLAGYILGWLVIGFGAIGQPHIMIRPMALRNPDDMALTRRIYVTWFTLFTLMCILVGLATRVLLPELMAGDTELALPTLASTMLPEVLVGLILAGLFSATISTADSQILSCSAAITQDLVPSWRSSYLLSKLGTIFSMLVVLGVVFLGSKNVFSLVVLAWSGLASTIGPLMLIRVMGWKNSIPTAMTMIVASFATVVVWTQGLQLGDSMNETLPAFIVSFLIYGVYRLMSKESVPQG